MRFDMSHEAPSLTMAAFSQPRLQIATRADGGTHMECLLFAHARQIDAHRSVVTGGNDHQVSTNPNLKVRNSGAVGKAVLASMVLEA